MNKNQRNFGSRSAQQEVLKSSSGYPEIPDGKSDLHERKKITRHDKYVD